MASTGLAGGSDVAIHGTVTGKEEEAVGEEGDAGEAREVGAAAAALEREGVDGVPLVAAAAAVVNTRTRLPPSTSKTRMTPDGSASVKRRPDGDQQQR